jgi:hypothetical protein
MGTAKVKKRAAYLEAIESNILEQPAVKVWLQINPNNELPTRIETLRRWASSKPFVCRMLGIGAESTSVIAKRCKLAAGLREKLFYEEILPQLGMSSLKYYGSYQEEDEHLWLFLENAGDQQFSFHKPNDCRAAVEWLMNLHTSSARQGKPSKLIERGPAYYYERLTTAKKILRPHVDRDIFSMSARQTLADTLDLINSIASNWDSIASLYERLPHCVIHGDFKSKNIHLRSDQQQTSVLVFDWEYAGWGIPGIDMWRLDEDQYLAAVKNHWPQTDITTIHELKLLGSIFRFIDSYFWEVQRLHHPVYPISKLKLEQNLSIFNLQMADALQMLNTSPRFYSQASG